MLIGPCCVMAMKTQASMRSRSSEQASMKLCVKSVSLWMRPRERSRSPRAFHANAAAQRSEASASAGRLSAAASMERRPRQREPRSSRTPAVSRMKRCTKASSANAS